MLRLARDHEHLQESASFLQKLEREASWSALISPRACTDCRKSTGRLMDSTVEKVASGFLSNQTSDVLEAMRLLDNGWLVAIQTKGNLVRFAKIIQELASYEQGRVMKKLMGNWLSRYDDTCEFGPQQEYLAGVSAAVIPKLTTSKVAAQVFLTGEGTVENLVFESARKFTRILYDQATPIEASLTFQAFSNFAQASKLFRKSMQELGLNPLPPIHKVLAEEYLKQASKDDMLGLRESLARMIEALSLSEDSRLWLVDSGFIQILPELYGSRMHRDSNRIIVLSRCTIALLRLISSEDALAKMRESGFLSALEPHSTVLNESLDNADVWDFVRDKLTNAKNALKLNITPGGYVAWKDFKRSVFCTPVVCSWRDCEATEYTGDLLEHSEHATALSRCGRCGVARYCRWVLLRCKGHLIA